MADAGAIKAGRAFVELFADPGPLSRGLAQAQAKLKAWGQAMTTMGARMAAAGAAALTPMLLGARKFAQEGTALWDLSQKTGASVEGLSRLENAATLAGGGLGDVASNIAAVQHTLVAMAEGATEPAYALSALGTSFAELKRLAPEDQLALIAEKMQRIASPVTRGTIAQRLGLSEKFGAMAAQMGAGSKLGTTTTAEAKAAKDAQVAWLSLQTSLSKMWATVGSALIPELTRLVGTVTRMIVPAREWLQENKSLVIAIAGLAGGAVIAGGALLVLGKAITALTLGGGALKLVFTVATGAISALIPVVAGLLTPFGLVAAAVASGGAAYLVYSGKGAQALAYLGEKFNVLKQTAVTAWSGISDAMAAGDFGLAAQIAVEGVKVAWSQIVGWFTTDVIDPVMDAWNGLSDFFSKWGETVQVFATAGVDYVQERWTQVADVIGSAWTAATDFLGEQFNRLSSFIQNLIDKLGVLTGAVAMLQRLRIEIDWKTVGGALVGPGLGGALGPLADPKFQEKLKEANEKAAQARKEADEAAAKAQDQRARDRAARDQKMAKEQADRLAKLQELADKARQARADKEVRDKAQADKLKEGVPAIEAVKAKISQTGSFSGLAMWGSARGQDFGMKIAQNTYLGNQISRQILQAIENIQPGPFV